MFLLVIMLMTAGCTTNVREANQANPPMNNRPDINTVMEAHTKELMSLKGVVGVYVGALDDGRACIGVMVDTLTPLLRSKIPSVIEGYPVRVEESGPIRPMKNSP